MLRIPTNPDYSSLNITSAVQLVGYELRVACEIDSPAEAGTEESPARQEDMQRFYAALEQVLVEIDFLDPANPRLLLRRLRRLFNRAQVSDVELNILRGILTAMAKQAEKARAIDDRNPL